MSLPRLAGVVFALTLVAIVASIFYYRLSSVRAIANDPDVEVLNELKRAGTDLSNPHAIDFCLYFPNEVAARDAAAQLLNRGFAISLFRSSGLSHPARCLLRFFPLHAMISRTTRPLTSVNRSLRP